MGNTNENKTQANFNIHYEHEWDKLQHLHRLSIKDTNDMKQDSFFQQEI